MKNILCHVGPWSEKLYHSIASQISPSSKISILSGHPACDQSGLFNYYHKLVKSKKSIDQKTITPLELDIILRCRLLRSMERQTALLHLRAMWDAVGGVLDRTVPDLILSETIDSYIMDVLFFQSRQRNIVFIGLVSSFVSGYFRITARGEYTNSRKVDFIEVRKVSERLLKKKYKPDFIHNSDSKLWFYALSRWARNIVKVPYFFLLRLNSRERYNYHNWATFVVSKQWFHFFPALHLGKRNWNELVNKSSKKIIYVPLQMIPEATVDYWCEEIEAADYNRYFVGLVQKFSSDFTLLIKEHPNVLGYRNPEFYTQLCKFESVIFAPTSANSHDLIEASDAILVWTGSVGFEAAIRGKAVLTTCKPYYLSGSVFKHINLDTPLHEITAHIDLIDKNLTEENRDALVAHLLSGILPGRHTVDGSWSADNAQHCEDAKNIAVQLKAYLEYAPSEI